MISPMSNLQPFKVSLRLFLPLSHLFLFAARPSHYYTIYPHLLFVPQFLALESNWIGPNSSQREEDISGALMAPTFWNSFSSSLSFINLSFSSFGITV